MRGGWSIVPAQGPLGLSKKTMSGFLCEARGGWAIVPTQGPLGNKSSKWFRVFYYSLLHGLIRSAGSQEKKETVHLSFPTEGGRAAEAFSLFSHTDGKIRDGYGEDGCGRKVVGTERLILTQHSPYL
jgi:hypothetical protein